MIKIAIIGAGLSGLTTASFLKDFADITLFEKARGVSGRMSTRCAEPYFFDHGAQYFTARTQAFQQFIQPLIGIGLIKRWNARYVKFDDDKMIERRDWGQGEPRYVGVPGMHTVAKHLGANFDVKLNTRIVNLRWAEKWQLEDEQGTFWDGFDWVISTVPAPQAVDFLPGDFLYLEEIKAIKMDACFSLMLGFSTPLPLSFEVAHITNADLSWLAINSAKPGRPETYTLMAHSSKEYAKIHIDDDHDEVIQHLCSETSRITGNDVSVADYKILHRWRYANNAKKENCSILIDHQLQRGVCGDWCLGGRVEGAFTSAYNLSEKIKECIS